MIVYPEEYMQTRVVWIDEGVITGGGVVGAVRQIIKVRWEPEIKEIVDIYGDYSLTTAKIMTTSPIKATRGFGDSKDAERHYIVHLGVVYRVIQDKLMADLDGVEGTEMYREIYVGPVGA